MAFFQLVLQARKLEKARLRYEDEKLRSIEISEGVKPHLTLKQRLRRKRLKYRKKFKHFWNRIISPLKHIWIYKKMRLLSVDGSFENYILKSIFGFLFGIFLTYMFFVFFVIQLSFTLSSATILCSILGMILTLGLAFSHRVRCIVFLLLPQFFSKRGRQALMAYAFILTLTGPAKNILHNISVLSESLACGQIFCLTDNGLNVPSVPQSFCCIRILEFIKLIMSFDLSSLFEIEQLKQAVKNVVDLIKEPFYALRDAISKVIKAVKVVVMKIKRTLVAIKRLVLSILRVITSVFQWLGSIVNICNKKLGTPFDRCQRVFEGAVDDCKAKLGPLFGGICNLAYVVGALCYVVKPLDFICILVSYVADTIVNAVQEKIKRFTRHIKAMFYVKVKFSHSFHFETNQTKTIEDVSTGIITEIRARTDRFLAVFDWMSFTTTFFIFFMLLRILHYRHKWLTSDRFDNRYLTDDLRTIDLIRTRQDKETILPLNRRERNQYIPLTSVTLIKVEKIKLAKSAVFLSLTMFKICIHMMADYSLYWILSTIRYHGRIETKVQRPNFVGVHVSGDGYLADLYRSIVKAFTPHAKDTEIDVIPCLPDPIPPDLDRYTQIVTLIAFCWIMAIFEPYGLRLRHVVLCKYYPERAKQRAAWLYNHIIRSRGSFLKFARRQLRRKFGMTEGERIERVTFRERCLAICPFLNKLFPQKQNVCLLCGSVERSDREPHIKCAMPGCLGLFCIQCFADLQNLCTICRSPIEYGDLSDISEERDSSDDQLIARKEPVPVSTYVDEKEEPIVEEKPKEEVEIKKEIEEEISEKRVPEEIIPEEKVPEEKILEKRISEERKEERTVVEKKNVAVQTDDDTSGSSSESVYSYTYQEGSREIEVEHRRIPFKDIEAQKIREDVTIQIFNEPLAKEVTSSSEDPTSCFMVRARRRLRTRLKRKSCSSLRKNDSSSSTSIADTESCATQELDEEEVIHIEIDDGSKELLLKDGTAKARKRSSRVGRILAALTKISWLGKRTTTDSDGEWRMRKPSLLDRIVRMLSGNQSTSPVQTYRRIRTTKKDAKHKSSSSVSSSSTDEENEQHALLKAYDRQVNCLQIISDHDDSEDNIYSRNYDSHRARRGTICRQPDSHMRADDVKLRHPHEKKFTMKKLPRYLQPISKDTAYFEVNEIIDSQSKRGCVRPTERVNILPDTRIFDNQKSDKSNVTSDDYSQIPCSCMSQTSCDVKDSISQSDVSVTEQCNKMSKTDAMSETELLTTDWERLDQKKKAEEIVTTEETSIDSEIEQQRAKALIENNRRGSLAKNSKTIAELNNFAEEIGVRKYFAKKKQTEELSREKKAREEVIASTSEVNEKARLYDPLASSELYSVTCQVKRREKPAMEKLTKQSGTAEIRIDDRKSANFEEDIEMEQKSVQVSTHETKKSVPEKSIQTDLQKSEKYKRCDKMLHIDTQFSRAADLKKKKKKEKRRHEKWIEKYKRKQREPDSSSPRRKQKYCNKPTLIKEKLYDRRKQEKIYSRDMQIHGHPSRTNWCPDDIRRRRRVVPPLRSVAELREDRQTQCNLRDREDTQSRKDDAYDLKSANKPEVWSCHVQPQFTAPEQIACYQDYQRKLLSSYNNDLSEKKSQQIKKKYDVNIRKTRLEVPMLKKYLPAYQAPGLIEELKEHDRMRLIQEREARRWTALSAFRSTRDSPSSTKSKKWAYGTSVMCDAHESVSRLTSVSTRLTEGNTLPYQETQTFKDVVREFRKKVMKADKPLISLSQRADKCNDLKQLFPPKNDHVGITTTSKFEKVVNKFKDQYVGLRRSAESRKERNSGSFSVNEEKGENIMKEQEPENKAENDNRMPEANCACTSETCGEKRIKREICMDILAKKKLLAHDKGISPTRLSSEMINKEINDSLKQINNSIKDAMKTLVKTSMEEKKSILPCSKEPKGISDTCRSRALEEHCKESLNVCTNRQTTCHVSRQRDKLSTHDSSYMCKKMYENAIPLPVQNKVNGERKSKKHSKSANNVNTDNRRMTGNVNIYICSETNDSNQCSSCLILFMRKVMITSKEETDVKVNNENVRCKDATSSTKDDYYCKDTDNIDLQQDSSYLTVPCSSFSACNNTKHPESWMTTYPSEPKARLDDNGVFLSRAICTGVEQRNYRKNNDRNNNVRGNDSECTMCHAVDGSRWLPKSIYKKCAFGEEPREYFADGCKYRNKIFQDSSINHKDIRKRQTGYKRLQQPLGSCQREVIARRWSTCSCIAEEDENYCKDIKKDKKELPQNVCNVAESLEKISICRSPRKLIESVTVCETSCGDEKRFEKLRTCKKKEEHLKDTSVYKTRFGNSVEPPKVTRVCQEFVTEELPEDITVRKTAFGEPNRLPEEEIVYKAERSDSKDNPKETICKEILDSNFANQDDVNRVSLNDVKDKLVEESTTSSNLNSPEKNAGNKRMVKPNNKHDIALNSFMEQQSINVEQDEQINKMMNNRSKNVPRTPNESIKDSKPLSKNVYSTLPRAQFYNRSNLVSNFSVEKTSKFRINQQRMQSLNRSMRNHFQQSNNPTQNLISNKNNQQEEKTLGNSEEKEERQDISKEMKTNQTMPKLLRVIAAKRSHVLPIVVTTDSKPRQSEVLSVPAEKITTHVDQEKLSEEKVTLQEHKERTQVQKDHDLLPFSRRMCESQERCSNCGKLRNQCYCATFTLVKCHKNKKTSNRKRTMICLYCDNPRDKCTCRAPIGKCLYCGLPSDVCNCQGDQGHVRESEQIAKRLNENRTICVTSWKPKREIRRYFERNYKDFEPYFTKKCQCCKKPKRQHPEELPYQRLNVFSEVMNELQQKMSESVCCARCWRNPCCCGLPVDEDKRKEERKAENCLKYIKEFFV
ncbi:DC-STAMP domain-containing protein 2 [Trachymyrmex cornetzi]|uniref:DC-STAMP domain-containing protein 2 n=1 Tax=Trachymyrmex cornetzi TaxID=471704 RepID=A0A195DFT2_9HYME|nr:DC-STAMP domain-containing protein 2 [Trachymyrmex cornetzi]